MRYAGAECQRVHMMIQREDISAHILRAFAVGEVTADGMRI